MTSWKPTTLIPWLSLLAGVCASLVWLAQRLIPEEPQTSKEVNVVDLDPDSFVLRITGNPSSSGSLVAKGIRADLSLLPKPRRVGRSNDYRPVLKLWDTTTGKDTLFLTYAGPPISTRRALIQIVELDVDNKKPEVLLSRFTGYGPDCCALVTIFRENDEGKWKAIDAGNFNEDIFAATKPVPEYAYMLTTYDNRFLYRFPGYMSSPPPRQFFALRGDQIIDVSDLPHLRPIFEKDAQSWAQDLADSSSPSNGMLAAYAATHARAGRIEDVWPVILEKYDRGSQVGLWDYPNFPSALAAVLRETGYVSEDLVLPVGNVLNNQLWENFYIPDNIYLEK